MRHTHARPQQAGPGISVCLFRAVLSLDLCLCWLVLLPAAGHAQTWPPTNPNELLATDPRAFGQWLHTARPTPVSPAEKTRILATLPLDGEVTDVKVGHVLKLAGIKRALQQTDRGSVYVVKVIDVPQAAIVLHERAVVLVSEAALGLLNTDELHAVVAHEIGHEYVWDEYARASARGDWNRVKELELMCDAIAIVALSEVGLDSSRLISGIEKISLFNKGRLGTADNERNYPTLVERRAFARRIRAWLSGPA